MKATEDEFRELVERHQAMVYSIAYRILGNREGAEEAAQDTFLKLYSALWRLKSADHITFWLRRTAVHRAADYLRRRKRRPEATAETWQEHLHGAIPGATAGNGAVEWRLDQLLASLPQESREVIVLRYQEEMKPGEIAKLLGEPLPLVKRKLHRALELLRRKSAVVLKEFVRE